MVQPSRKRPAREATRTSGRRRSSPVQVRDRKDVDLLLLAVARDGVASGREFIEQVRRRSSGTLVVSERSVYHQLHRLRNERLIRDTGRGDARRFVLTPLGERVLATRIRGWEKFAQGLDRVLASGDPAPRDGGDPAGSEHG